jgi:hypothetical protein
MQEIDPGLFITFGQDGDTDGMADKTRIAPRQHIKSMLRPGFTEYLDTFSGFIPAPFQILFNQIFQRYAGVYHGRDHSDLIPVPYIIILYPVFK